MGREFLRLQASSIAQIMALSSFMFPSTAQELIFPPSSLYGGYIRMTYLLK